MSSVRAARMTFVESTSRTTRNTLRASRTSSACRRNAFSDGIESDVGDAGVLEAMFINWIGMESLERKDLSINPVCE